MSTLLPPLQYCFFKVDVKQDLAALREKEAELSKFKQAPNTAKAYGQAWKNFCRWCGEWQRDPLPATSDTVKDFVVWASEMRQVKGVLAPYHPTTIILALSAIATYHREAGLPNPILDPCVGEAMSGVKRKAARSGDRVENAGKKHLTVEHLRKICAAMGTETIDVRDRALILLGFASALRRCDIGRMLTDHVHFEAKRVRLWVPLSKTDQEGKGRNVYLYPAKDRKLCPVRALEAWRDLRREHYGHFRGPLFLRFSTWGEMQADLLPLGDQRICNILKARLERVGEDGRDYGAHSMRSGMITAADASGATLRSIMDCTGHASINTVMRYTKSNPEANPLRGVL